MSGETGRTMVIGIAGGTGSGKTTVTRKIKEYFGEDVSVIYHDSYYKRHDELPYEEIGRASCRERVCLSV